MALASVTDVPLEGRRTLRAHRWPGRGRPLILLHGLLDDATGWAAVAADTHRPAIALDLPGFGGSSLPTRSRISAYAEDVVEALEWFGIENCTLVGHSLGGAVAAAVAERTRAVDSLVLLAPAGFGSIRLADTLALPGIVNVAERALPLGLVNPLVVTGAYAAFVGNGSLPSRDLLRRLQRRAFSSGPGVRAAVEAISAAAHSPRRFTERGIDFGGPVAALWGARDALVPVSHAGGVRAALPHADVAIWQGMGHHPQRERPVQLSRYIERRATRARPAVHRRRVVADAA